MYTCYLYTTDINIIQSRITFYSKGPLSFINAVNSDGKSTQQLKTVTECNRLFNKKIPVTSS